MPQNELLKKRLSIKTSQSAIKNILIKSVPSSAEELAEAVVCPLTKYCLKSAQLLYGLFEQTAVFDIPIQGFPTDGNSFIVLSSGKAALAYPGPSSETANEDEGGTEFPPGSDYGEPTDTFSAYDVVTLLLTFKLPGNPSKLSFDWKFATEEIPFSIDFIDYFRADITTSAGRTNIALFTDNSVVNVPNAVPYVVSPSPDDIIYNAITEDMSTASIDLSPFGGEEITLALTVGDDSDHEFDSAAFIDNVRIEGCKQYSSKQCRGYTIF